MTLEKSEMQEKLMSSVGDSPAKTSHRLTVELPDLLVVVQDSGMSLQELSQTSDQAGLLLKTCQDFSLSTMDMISSPSSKTFKNTGIVYRGACLTLNSSESPKDADACTLSEVLEMHVPQKYYLSKKCAMGILRRAKEREKPCHLFWSYRL